MKGSLLPSIWLQLCQSLLAHFLKWQSNYNAILHGAPHPWVQSAASALFPPAPATVVWQPTVKVHHPLKAGSSQPACLVWKTNQNYILKTKHNQTNKQKTPPSNTFLNTPPHAGLCLHKVSQGPVLRWPRSPGDREGTPSCWQTVPQSSSTRVYFKHGQQRIFNFFLLKAFLPNSGAVLVRKAVLLLNTPCAQGGFCTETQLWRQSAASGASSLWGKITGFDIKILI